jgi:LPXTG-motif cell wall-anchored protein
MYGMNIGLPYQNDPNAFLLLMVVMILLTGGLIFLFKRKHWM